jgi:hypothetical protein
MVAEDSLQGNREPGATNQTPATICIQVWHWISSECPIKAIGKKRVTLFGLLDLGYLAELSPAGSPIMLKYSCISDGTQISSRSSWFGIHLNWEVVITKGFV